MKLLEGQKGLIMGVANQRSIAAFIAKKCYQEGARLAFNHLEDPKGKMLDRLKTVADPLEPFYIAPCDVTDEKQVDSFFTGLSQKTQTLDFLVHSIAFAPLEDIRCQTLDCSRDGFLKAMNASVYSFINSCQRVAQLMPDGGSIITMSYFGAEKVVAGYNLMGIAKAALEASVRYLAYDLGPRKIRVNALSAGPIKTLAASAIGDFQDMLGMNQAIAPLARNVNCEEVANSALYLLSSMSSATTGEVLHVDCGYNMMGSPGRAFSSWGIRPSGKAL